MLRLHCISQHDFLILSPMYRPQWDDRFALLKNYPNVIISPHSAFFTTEALTNIANTTVENLQCMMGGGDTKNEVKCAQ